MHTLILFLVSCVVPSFIDLLALLVSFVFGCILSEIASSTMSAMYATKEAEYEAVLRGILTSRSKEGATIEEIRG